MYVPKPGQSCTIWHAGVCMPVVGDIWGEVGGGGGVQMSLIINLMSISKQFLTSLKTNS